VNGENAQVVEAETVLPYSVVSMNSTQAGLATQLKRTAERQSFIADSAPQGLSLGVGDVVQITIVSTNDTGFVDIANSQLTPISSTSLPPQTVGPDGMISVPPIGRVRAAGNTVQGFERFLTRRLSEVLVEPTAIVQLTDRKSSQVTLVGGIAAPGTYSINQENRHLVEVIAKAGGTAGPAENMRVIMTRSGRTGTASLKDIYENPKLNVHLRSGDVVRFEPFQGEFTVLGAGGVNANLQFNDTNTNLINALGQSGGILRNRADPRGVFVYRVVSRNAASKLGVDTSNIAGDSVPVVFQFDMKQPQAPFVAQEFEIADRDILYVSTTIISEVNAALSAFGAFIPAPREIIASSATSN
jgi:polysaccharide export outer membrane protein